MEQFPPNVAPSTCGRAHLANGFVSAGAPPSTQITLLDQPPVRALLHSTEQHFPPAQRFLESPLSRKEAWPDQQGVGLDWIGLDRLNASFTRAVLLQNAIPLPLNEVVKNLVFDASLAHFGPTIIYCCPKKIGARPINFVENMSHGSE